MTDTRGKILYANSESKRLLKRRDLKGHNYRDVLNLVPLDPSSTGIPFGKCVAGGKEVPRRMSLNPGNGDNTIVELHLYPLLDRSGKSEGCIFLLRNITSIYEKEVLLKESEEKFRAVAESSPLGIFLYQNLRWIYLNPAAEKICGYSKDELIGKYIWEIVHSDFKEMVRVREEMREGGMYVPSYEFKIITPEGEERWVNLSGAPITIKGGGAGLVTVVDVTEKRQMEEKLSRNKVFYKAIFDSSSAALAVVDRELTIIHANKKFEDLFKINRMLLEHKRNLKDFLHPHQLEDIILQLSILPDRGKKLPPVEITGVNALSEPLYLLCSIAPIPQSDTFVVSLQDITTLKEMQRINIDLERQLKQSQKMEAIGLLAGGIAHDFNNILQGIYSGLSLIQKDVVGEDVKILGNIEELIHRGSKLIKGLLAFGRRDTMSKFSHIAINRIVQDVIDLFNTTIPRNIAITTYLSEEELVVPGDSMQIQQVLMNLLSNAVDAIGEDGGEIIIYTAKVCRVDEFDSLYALIVVEDSGEGIDEKYLDKIYDPFFTTKPANKGSGLGLSIVYGILRDHKGDIVCKSKKGEGTTFEIYLPLAPVAGEEEKETEEEVIVEEQREEEGRRGHIFLVDDEEMILETTSEYLREFGYEITIADTGEKALSLFEERFMEFDLVLLDLNLPGISGHELLKRFLRIKPEVKIIVCSGYSPEELNIPETAAKNISFLAKPYSMKSLLRKVKHKLSA